MLSPMLASVHNRHDYLFLMREIRAAPDAGGFGALREQLGCDPARGVWRTLPGWSPGLNRSASGRSKGRRCGSPLRAG